MLGKLSERVGALESLGSLGVIGKIGNLGNLGSFLNITNLLNLPKLTKNGYRKRYPAVYSLKVLQIYKFFCIFVLQNYKLSKIVQ